MSLGNARVGKGPLPEGQPGDIRPHSEGGDGLLLHV